MQTIPRLAKETNTPYDQIYDGVKRYVRMFERCVKTWSVYYIECHTPERMQDLEKLNARLDRFNKNKPKCDVKVFLDLDDQYLEHEVDTMLHFEYDAITGEHEKLEGPFLYDRFLNLIHDTAALQVCTFFCHNVYDYELETVVDMDALVEPKMFVRVQNDARKAKPGTFFIRWNNNESQLAKMKADMELETLFEHVTMDLDTLYTEDYVDEFLATTKTPDFPQKYDGLLLYDDAVKRVYAEKEELLTFAVLRNGRIMYCFEKYDDLDFAHICGVAKRQNYAMI